MEISAVNLLGRCRHYQLCAQENRADYERLRGGSSHLDPITLTEIKDIEKQYRSTLRTAEQLAAYVTRAAMLIPAPQGNILRLRYISLMSWRQIASETMYAESHCYDLHRQALRSLQRVLDTEPPPAPAGVLRQMSKRRPR